MQKNVRELATAAVCLALCLFLPFLTGQIPQWGNMLSPMHIPVLLCGLLCGWPYATVVGFIAPALRFALFGMPPLMPTGLAMMVELAVYGLASSLLRRALPKRPAYLYVSLILAMLLGRVAWGAARLTLAGLNNGVFTFAEFPRRGVHLGHPRHRLPHTHHPAAGDGARTRPQPRGGLRLAKNAAWHPGRAFSVFFGCAPLHGALPVVLFWHERRHRARKFIGRSYVFQPRHILLGCFFTHVHASFPPSVLPAASAPIRGQKHGKTVFPYSFRLTGIAKNYTIMGKNTLLSRRTSNVQGSHQDRRGKNGQDH